ncbi:hypothetical protein WH87_12405 [Devosia epidermidihirudinis]|uniref:diguanylate cyclase n=1 Tax=Devosia epidermidihirudinis TaxID=1293439 RepID=A0A0F5Q8U1_9HYPH|nr:GGDEF domain-containing protein [Devosia epidermidihirudinis]KKC37340.1 hypothetical protein WH87_12405 [Devosia epidermidihirudinis]
MLLDNVSLLVAVGVSSIAMMAAMLIGWAGSRRDSYLISWTIGMAVVVIGIIILGQRGGPFVPLYQFSSYFMLVTGIAIIYGGARQFSGEPFAPLHVAALWGPAALGMAVAYLLGLSGIGTIVLNLACAIFMMLCARRYWQVRGENSMALSTTSVLYALTGISFLLCSAVLLFNGQWVLYGAPDNWAETANSIMSIIGLSCIGALSLTLNHSRTAKRHRQDAMTDPLTNLLNRRALFDRFGEDGLPQNTAVLMLDLDHFKQINDLAGHAAGDSVIQHFANILRANTRKDDVAARLGGEEFCVVMTGQSAETVAMIAERIRAGFGEYYLSHGNLVLRPTVSIGVAMAGEGEPFPSTLSRADGALYGAKRSGRNRIQTAALRDAA